jgi:hypothetical protein
VIVCGSRQPSPYFGVSRLYFIAAVSAEGWALFQTAALLAAMAQALWVVGAGTKAVNGKYDKVEDLNARPQYRRKVGCVSS